MDADRTVDDEEAMASRLLDVEDGKMVGNISFGIQLLQSFGLPPTL